jgi:hypothetical protein
MRSSSNHKVQEASTRVSQSLVYEHPTLDDLAQAIVSLVSFAESNKRDPIEEIKAAVDSFTGYLPIPQYDARSNAAIPTVVLLTGSTGNVGAHVLSSLLTEQKVSRVYTLNRTSAAGTKSRQHAAFVARGLPVDVLETGKLVELYGDITQDGFGLPKTAFNEVSLCTCI